jgi:Tol biopolymer transport system component
MRTPADLTVVLALVLASMVMHVRSGIAQESKPPERGFERVLSESPTYWFEGAFTAADVSHDGRWAISYDQGVRVIDLQGGQLAPHRVWSGVADPQAAVFGPDQQVVLLGRREGKTGWFTRGRGTPRLLPIPSDARPRWAPGGQAVAFSRAGTDSVYVGPIGRARAYRMPGVVTGLAWLPDGGSLVVLAREPSGTSTLFRLELTGGHSTLGARDLDAPTCSSPVAVGPDGRKAYLAVASSGTPAPELRHVPYARRRLGVYQVDLATGIRRAVVPAPEKGDAFAPSIAAGHLYWTHTTTDESIVVIPAMGGPARLVWRGGEVPSWRPDGRQIGFVYGESRLADWALNLDGGAVDVDSGGRPAGPLQPVITGYHEDFQPVWSPRGRWIAYHSHRPRTPVPGYDAPGSTDDIWLRRVGAPARDTSEIRLTDFGLEAGSPDWSRDGTQLLFTSFEKGGPGDASYPYVVTIDTATGKALKHHRLPLPKPIRNALWAAWSPVSDGVALEEDLGRGRHALWVVTGDGARARKLTDYAMRTYGGVTWDTDGKRLVYAALTEGRMQLFAIPAAGGVPRQLTDDAASLFTPRGSPDGRFIAATRISHRRDLWRLTLGE